MWGAIVAKIGKFSHTLAITRLVTEIMSAILALWGVFGVVLFY